MHYVYMVECNDGTYYIGYTTDVARRVEEHNKGRGAKYTRGRRPVKVIYIESFEEKTTALKREYEMKQLTRIKKEALKEKFMFT